MWYFSWILGVLLACAFGIINVMWYEFHTDHFDANEGDEKEPIKQDLLDKDLVEKG